MLRKLVCQWVGITILATMAISVTAHASSISEWKPVLYQLPTDAVQASTLGAIPDDPGQQLSHDVTAALQNAFSMLRPGQTLLLSPGIYHISAPLLIPSGISLQGQQDRGGVLLSTLVQTAPFGTWLTGKLKLGMLMNKNYDASTPLDSNITVTAVGFDDQSAGILFRMTRDIRIQGCHFDGGGDGVAFLASHRTIVTDSLTTNTTNAAYDYWDGDVDSTVKNSAAVLAGGYGISFNAIDTDGSGRIATNFSAINNTISGAGANAPAIYVNPLGGGSKITGAVTLQDNKITSPQPGVQTGGIFVADGDANAVTIRGNYISGANAYQPIFVGGNRKSEGYANPGRPMKVVISGNTIEHNVIANFNGAVIWAEGNNVYVSRNIIVDNVSEKGAVMPFLRSSGHVYSWGNKFVGGGDVAKSYMVLPENLTLHAPRSGE